MMHRTADSYIIRALLAVAISVAALPFAFVQSAFAERVEGPLRADESAYEHLDDGKSDEQLFNENDYQLQDGDMVAQGGSSYMSLGITLEQMASYEVAQNGGSHGYTYDRFLSELNPNNCALTMFADLTSTSGLTAAQIDAYIDSQAKGRSGKLHGMGPAFLRAEQTYHVNASYLVAHAILETGWGSSDLAKGYAYDGKTAVGSGSNSKTYPAGTYYNFFGIGAYDSSPLSGGRSKAIQEGWNSPEAAVMGGAQWIASNYTYRSTYPQKTLYNMKWDYERANREGSCWHQYATGIDWPKDIARLMEGAYSSAGKAPNFNYIIPQYKGAAVPDTNQRSMFRMYNPNSGEHFYTSNITERGNLEVAGWNYEGVAWTAPKSSNTPVYRLYNPNVGDHHYTVSAGERDHLVKVGWRDEGIGWYSDDSQGQAVYRLYNPNARTGTHHYTTAKGENDVLVSKGWRAEGIGFYGM